MADARVTVDWLGVAIAALWLTLFAMGLRWSYLQLREPKPATSSPSKNRKVRCALSLMGLLVSMFAAGIFFLGISDQVGGLLKRGEPLLVQKLALGDSRRESGRNLQSIGIAVHSYHDYHRSLPLAATDTGTGIPRHSWQTMILPFVYSGYLEFGMIDAALPWDHPRNAAYFERFVPAYLNPGLGMLRDPRGFAPSHYAGNSQLWNGEIRAFGDVIDGTSNTIMAGEVAGEFKPWGDPTNLRDPATGLNRSLDGFASPSETGVVVVFMDGSVDFISNDIDPRVLKALSTPAGHDKAARSWTSSN